MDEGGEGRRPTGREKTSMTDFLVVIRTEVAKGVSRESKDCIFYSRVTIELEKRA